MTAAPDADWDRLRADSRQALPEALAGAASLPAVLLPYQQRLLATTAVSQLVVVEKSRRIGMTWGVGADAVLTAGATRAAGGMDVLYIGFSQDLAREFIDVAAMWARAFLKLGAEVQEFLFADQDDQGGTRMIQAFRIQFASGFEVVALTSKPRSLRGRQGYVIFDEAAFHDQLAEMLKAAMALLMWGGKVLVISTHNGADNAFNDLIQEIREGRRKGQVLRVTFDDAVADGLYERIALTTRRPATSEAKSAWIADTFAFYGSDADEELRCIPKMGSGVYISRAAIEACMGGEHQVVRLACPSGFELRPLPERAAFVATWCDEALAPVLARLDPTRRHALGQDFGRTSDLTVIAVGEELANLTLAVPLMVELKNMPVREQQAVLGYIVARLPRFGAAKLDSTGNGLALAEWAQDQFGRDRVEAVKITQGWYLEHVPKLKARIDDRTILLPQDADIRDDIRAFTLVGGIPSIPERSGGRHGDAGVALVMLVAANATDVVVVDFIGAGQRASTGAYAGDFGPVVTGTAGWGSTGERNDLRGF